MGQLGRHPAEAPTARERGEEVGRVEGDRPRARALDVDQPDAPAGHHDVVGARVAVDEPPPRPALEGADESVDLALERRAGEVAEAEAVERVAERAPARPARRRPTTTGPARRRRGRPGPGPARPLARRSTRGRDPRARPRATTSARAWPASAPSNESASVRSTARSSSTITWRSRSPPSSAGTAGSGIAARCASPAHSTSNPWEAAPQRPPGSWRGRLTTADRPAPVVTRTTWARAARISAPTSATGAPQASASRRSTARRTSGPSSRAGASTAGSAVTGRGTGRSGGGRAWWAARCRGRGRTRRAPAPGVAAGGCGRRRTRPPAAPPPACR